MKRSCFIGVDTSNYTTSLAIVDDTLDLIANLKLPLKVKEGELGLRQSDAVFAHVKNIPQLMEMAKPYLDSYKVCAVGVSSRPRNQEGSYMPCFLSGLSCAKSIATFLDIPLYEWSHQCGHIMAAIFDCGQLSLLKREFGAFHVSGGTTELVKCNYYSGGFHAEIVGGTKDLHAGHLIDRIGVQLQLPFPCGPKLEQLALSNTLPIPSKKPTIDGTYVNLSGAENLAMSLYHRTNDKSLTCAFVIKYLGDTLITLGKNYLEEYGQMPLVFSGGVMSNSILQKMIKPHFECFFAKPALSCDNAVGIAVLTALRHIK